MQIFYRQDIQQRFSLKIILVKTMTLLNENLPTKLFLQSFKRPTIIFIIFWDFLMSYQIFISPQVKRCVIISYKHGT